MDFREKHEPRLQGLLDRGEQLRGICAATQQSTFKGRAVAIGVTDRRLLLQPLDRRGEPSGEAQQEGVQALADWFAQAGSPH